VPLRRELRRDDHTAFHVGMILTEIIDISLLFHHQPYRLFRCDGNIPVAVDGGSGMRQNVLVDPFDSIPDPRCYFGGDKDEPVDRDLNCCRPRRDGYQPEQSGGSQADPSRRHDGAPLII
jgi:hypothetical protein